jgi:PhoH-like ATPase
MSQKYFVLDTNVLLHDPASLLGFEDNIIVISPVVLQELDSLKSQNRAVSADARQVIRMLDKMLTNVDYEILSTKGVSRNEEGGKLIIPTLLAGSDLLEELAKGTNDQKIIRDALILAQNKGLKAGTSEVVVSDIGLAGTEIIFVSDDINARVIALSLGLKAEDYKGGRVKDESDEILESSVIVEEADLWNCNPKANNDEYTFDRKALESALGVHAYPHLVVKYSEECYFRLVSVSDEKVIGINHKIGHNPETFALEPHNIEQAAAMQALADDDVPLVILTGTAGSGKTLLSLAAGLEQTMGKKFNKIITARTTHNLDEDIGFLPGTEEEKVKPWLGAIQDNLEYLFKGESYQGSSADYAGKYIQYKSINFMRGRSIQDSFFILDEAQNLTPHQIRTLVTRVGEGTKIIVLGDLSQIDNPYLSKFSSGLTHLIERMKVSHCSAHVNLKGSPRSKLAEEAGLLL